MGRYKRHRSGGRSPRRLVDRGALAALQLQPGCESAEMTTGERKPTNAAAASDASLLERALRARDPDFDAAYAVLGKQYPVDRWVAVLANLAKHAENADLELVAHSTLRRPPAVINAVLELARARATAQAAFLAWV